MFVESRKGSKVIAKELRNEGLYVNFIKQPETIREYQIAGKEYFQELQYKFGDPMWEAVNSIDFDRKYESRIV